MSAKQSFFGKARARIKNRLAPEPVDPARFNDPVALETEWTLLGAPIGGVRFAIHGAVLTSADRLEFRMTRWTLLVLFSAPLVPIGLAVAMGIFYKNIGLANVMFLAGVVGLPGAITCGVIYFANASPFVFDKRLGYFWRGRRSPDSVFNSAELKNGAELSRLHALQLISRWNVSGGCYVFQLNAVLEDGTRIRVINHLNEKSIRNEVAILSTFLAKPVWDAIDMV